MTERWVCKVIGFVCAPRRCIISGAGLWHSQPAHGSVRRRQRARLRWSGQRERRPLQNRWVSYFFALSFAFLPEQPELGQPAFFYKKEPVTGKNLSTEFFFSLFGTKMLYFLFALLCVTELGNTDVKKCWKQYSVAWVGVMSIWPSYRKLFQRSHG